MRACILLIPVSFWAYFAKLIMPEWPHPVSMTNPLFLMLIINAWSSSVRGSGCQEYSIRASCPGNPFSKSVVLSTSPVIKTEFCNKNEGFRDS